MLSIYNFLVTIKAIARVILAVAIVGITVPRTEGCSGGSEPVTTKSPSMDKIMTIVKPATSTDTTPTTTTTTSTVGEKLLIFEKVA